MQLSIQSGDPPIKNARANLLKHMKIRSFEHISKLFLLNIEVNLCFLTT